jgi:signal transduction histidine kinase/ligand-binding sensor domain-containing protein
MRLLLVVALCPCAFGLNPDLEINQYAHKAWTVREGFFKGAIYSIAQMPDGYLWLGTEFGLERFDGVRSVSWQPPTGEHLPGGRIRSLLAARDGRLWIGTDQGLASWKDGKLTHYAELAGKTVLSILEDHEATIWAAAWAVASTEGKLCTIRDGRVQCYGDGRLGNGIDGLYEDSSGKLWAGNPDGVWRWKPEPAKFFPMRINTSSFAEGDGGELFITTLDGIKTLVNEQAGPYLIRAGGQQSQFGKLLRDRDGGLWVGTYDGGLLHVHHGRTDRFTHSDGLSSDNILYLFEDREGSIWVGTRNGLDRFRQFAVSALTAKQGLSSAFVNSILPARDGSIWLATANGLDKWKNGNVTVYGKRAGLADPVVLSSFEDQAGRIWVSTRRGLAYLERGKFVRVPNFRSGSVISIVGDNVGGIWISDQTTLYHLHGPTVVEEIPWIKLGHKDFSWTILPDPVRGGLWLGFRQGGVAYYKDHSIRMSYGREQGFGEGQVSGLKLDDDGALWAATDDGLNLIKNDHTFRLSSANGLPCDTVHSLIEDNDHFFWLYTACGLVRVARSELERWVADPKRTVSTTIFDNADGVQSGVKAMDSNPTVAKSADGKLWFVPEEGVSVVDPHHLALNKVVPPVHIQQIVADDKAYDLRSGMQLPAKARDVRIEYTALSLVAPEKIHFKYKLEGQDQDWKEVINDRHQAKYTNLPPGNYRFRVIACNNSGVWNEDGASLDFVIPPAWYQTNWFRALCALAVLTFLFATYEFRVRQLAYQFNMRLEERVSERTRIARDLHDTLLQSFQALLPLFQAALYQLPESAVNARKTLQSAVDRASDAIGEGRDAIKGLRESTIEKNELAGAIQAIGEELAVAENSETPTPFQVLVEGTPRNLHPILRDEVYRLAAEALRNAFRHSAAQKIEVEIRYDAKFLRLRVRDDGKGISPELLGGRQGHYGLPGMRERAALVGGNLTVWSEVNNGTEIELIIPASKAYATQTRRFWYFGERAATENHVKETKERD